MRQLELSAFERQLLWTLAWERPRTFRDLRDAMPVSCSLQTVFAAASRLRGFGLLMWVDGKGGTLRLGASAVVFRSGAAGRLTLLEQPS